MTFAFSNKNVVNSTNCTFPISEQLTSTSTVLIKSEEEEKQQNTRGESQLAFFLSMPERSGTLHSTTSKELIQENWEPRSKSLTHFPVNWSKPNQTKLCWYPPLVNVPEFLPLTKDQMTLPGAINSGSNKQIVKLELFSVDTTPLHYCWGRNFPSEFDCWDRPLWFRMGMNQNRDNWISKSEICIE